MPQTAKRQTVYLQVNPKTLELTVRERQLAIGWSIPVKDYGDKLSNPLHSTPLFKLVYFDLLYPHVQAADEKRGVKKSYSLIQPDPWLLGVVAVMWEGLVQGLTWDAIKAAVGRAVGVMRGGGLLSTSNISRRSNKSADTSRAKGKIEVGLAWREFAEDGTAQKELFLGVKREFDKRTLSERESVRLRKKRRRPKQLSRFR